MTDKFGAYLEEQKGQYEKKLCGSKKVLGSRKRMKAAVQGLKHQTINLATEI